MHWPIGVQAYASALWPACLRFSTMGDAAGVHTHDPRKLDRVWDERRKLRGKQPNGYITHVWKESGEITEVWVTFEKNQDGTQDKNVTIPFALLDGTYVSPNQGFVIGAT